MKFYENGQIWHLDASKDNADYEHVGVHTLDVANGGYFTLSDENGTYASISAALPLPAGTVLFKDAEKCFDFILRQLMKLDSHYGNNHMAFLRTTFKNADHMFDKLLDCRFRWFDFYKSLDAENTNLFIKAIIRL